MDGAMITSALCDCAAEPADARPADSGVCVWGPGRGRGRSTNLCFVKPRDVVAIERGPSPPRAEYLP